MIPMTLISLYLNMVGIASMEATIKLGRRQTTYTTYVEPILETRKNLKVVTYANVMKILIRQNHAYGVEYERHGTILNAFARKEVILSAGVYGTPMLLFKSGIGPKGMLKRAGVKLRFIFSYVGRQMTV